MVYSKNIAIVLSFVCLWLASLLTSTLETILGFVLILSFGILHGSNDLLLFDKLALFNKRFSKLGILMGYIAVVAIVFVFFYILPLLALALFIIFSAYHFGEQHWEHFKLDGAYALKSLFYLSYGLFILFLLFIFNKPEVIGIIDTIANFKIPPGFIDWAFVTTGLSFIISAVYLGLRNKVLVLNSINEMLYLLVFSVIFKISSLIWGFAIYFVLWHSLPSLYDQINFVYQKFNRKSLLDYIKNAIPYWLVSVIAILVFYYFFNAIDVFYALFFSFLAAVTFPHSVTISKMFRKMNK